MVNFAILNLGELLLEMSSSATVIDLCDDDDYLDTRRNMFSSSDRSNKRQKVSHSGSRTSISEIVHFCTSDALSSIILLVIDSCEGDIADR